MLDTNAKLALKELDDAKTRRKDLNDRFDADFELFCGKPFIMPAETGKWRNITSNRSQAEGWKIINILASSKRKLFIEEEGKNADERQKIANSEMLVNGLLYSADLEYDQRPDHPDVNSLMAFYQTLRGWQVLFPLVRSDGDREPWLDLGIWDIRNTYWVEGKNRIIRVFYERNDTVAAIRDEFPGFNKTADAKTGLVTITIVLDLDTKTNKVYQAVSDGTEWLLEPEVLKVGNKELKHIPIRIKAGGAVPLIYDQNTNNLEKVGESYLVNNRALQDAESELLTYANERASREAKAATLGSYDSAKGSSEPPDIERDPGEAGSILWLDEGKGQKIVQPMPMSPGMVINNALVLVQGMQSAGGLSKIAFGEQNIALTATGTDILNHNTKEHIWPFKLGMENSYSWLAQESVSQYKAGSFGTTKFHGYTAEFKKFTTDLKPSDILNDREFKAELHVNEVTALPTHSGMAIQERKANLLPLRELLSRHGLSDDPDRSIKALRQEQFEEATGTGHVAGLVAMIEDYADTKDKGILLQIDYAIRSMQGMLSQGQSAGGESGGQGLPEGGQGRPLSPRSTGLTARTAQASVPVPVQEAAQNGGV